MNVKYDRMSMVPFIILPLEARDRINGKVSVSQQVSSPSITSDPDGLTAYMKEPQAIDTRSCPN